MHRGTTPTFIFKFKDTDLEPVQDIAVTFKKSGRLLIEKSAEDITIDGNNIKVYLSQKETLSLPVGAIDAQVNILFDGGERGCTDIMSIQVGDNLKNEVMQ